MSQNRAAVHRASPDVQRRLPAFKTAKRRKIALSQALPSSCSGQLRSSSAGTGQAHQNSADSKARQIRSSKCRSRRTAGSSSGRDEVKAGVSSDRDGKQSAQMDSTDKNRFDAFMQLAEFRMDVRKERRQLKGQRAQPVLSRATLMSSADVTPALSLERQKKAPSRSGGSWMVKARRQRGAASPDHYSKLLAPPYAALNACYVFPQGATLGGHLGDAECPRKSA